MNVKRKIAGAIVLGIAIALPAHAGIDPVVATTVTVQTETLKATYHAREKKQNELIAVESAVATGMSAIHNVEKKMLEYLSNVSHAIQNLYQIKRAAALVVEIPKNAAALTDAVKKNPKGAVIAPIVSRQILELSAEATSLYPFMQQLVTKGSYNSGENAHKVNLLNSAERYYIASTILSRLSNINTALVVLRYQIQYASWDDLLRKLDRQTWMAYWNTKATAENVMYQWKYFKLANKYR